MIFTRHRSVCQYCFPSKEVIFCSFISLFKYFCFLLLSGFFMFLSLFLYVLSFVMLFVSLFCFLFICISFHSSLVTQFILTLFYFVSTDLFYSDCLSGSIIEYVSVFVLLSFLACFIQLSLLCVLFCLWFICHFLFLLYFCLFTVFFNYKYHFCFLNQCRY